MRRIPRPSASARVEHDDQQRPLVPLGMRHADDRRFATAGWPQATFSSSIEQIHSPPDLMTSLARSVICMKPCASMVATSPVSKKPSRRGLAAVGFEVAAARSTGRAPSDARGPCRPAAARARIVDDLHLDANSGRPCLSRMASCSLVAAARRSAAGRADRTERAHLGHAPGVDAPRRRSRPRSSRSWRAAPPSRRSRRACRCGACRCLPQVVEQRQPDGGHGGGEVTRSRRSARRRGAVERAPGITSFAPPTGAAKGRPQALAWNIGTTARMVASARCRAGRGSAASVCRTVERCE